MKKTQIIKTIRMARTVAEREIGGVAAHGFYGAGLASEGYSGGYRDALDDVLLLLEGGTLPCRRDYWTTEDGGQLC